MSWAIFALFFLSGAAALVYEVVWVRSLSLVFGGTHLAVTAVLSVFMGGLALGSFLIGRSADRTDKPLKLYGWLELGIALSAAAFIVLMKIYPALYGFLAQGRDDERAYLTAIRFLFSLAALIVPTTLMGGTLPVLTRFASGGFSRYSARLSFLYGLNTFGAVAGALSTAFFLLRFYSVSTALYTAVAINVLVGLSALLMQNKLPAPAAEKDQERVSPGERAAESFPLRMTLIGIGVSGFCALGYEVLWTRILTLTVGTSVYGFTIILAAFLAGIAAGSEAFGLLDRFLPSGSRAARGRILAFGLIQIVIGVLALTVTIHIRDLPVHSLFLGDFFKARGMTAFQVRLLANSVLAFAYVFVPALFMGLAFPLAGAVVAGGGTGPGAATGRVLTYNTIGAIMGSALSGFVLIYAFGIERSLQLLTIVNAGIGLIVLASLAKGRGPAWAAGGLAAAAALVLALNPGAFRVWDAKFFAIFQNNRPEAYDMPEKKQDALDNTDVLFYHEGVNSTISSVQIRGGHKAVLVNGKVVASSALRDQQCQLTLGHLPLLLHREPKKALVVGLGTGMTLGAVSVHPGLEELTLAEIEPDVLGAARTFAEYNNRALDHPGLRIVLNDGRNFLTTTKNRYDVITADPIHPWTQGSGYLYTSEYFRIASERLLPGGIMCQWLPIYELNVADLKSVVRTFSLHFKYTMAWLTQYDAELIGSNEPIVLDEKELERRIAHPAVRRDLERVMMGSATDFLGYFLMGTRGMQAFGADGPVNTDDNLYLEFSTPRSVGVNVMRFNINALSRHREGILPYLAPASEGAGRTEQARKWAAFGEAALLTDRAQGLHLALRDQEPEFGALLAELDARHPRYARARFLKQEYLERQARVPEPLEGLSLAFRDGRSVELVAVLARVSGERAAVLFVDNAARKIYGQRYFSGPGHEEALRKFAHSVLAEIQALYAAEARASAQAGARYPAAAPTLEKIERAIALKTEGV